MFPLDDNIDDSLRRIADEFADVSRKGELLEVLKQLRNKIVRDITIESKKAIETIGNRFAPSINESIRSEEYVKKE